MPVSLYLTEIRKEIGKLLKQKQKEKIYDTIGNRYAVRVRDSLTEYKALKKGRARKMNEVWKEYKGKEGNTKTWKERGIEYYERNQFVYCNES